ncbi:MAG: YeeE/YedE family protein [Piscinibacter sp.]|nr:YeeE/YedE family protein [Piscinibacter sp.]
MARGRASGSARPAGPPAQSGQGAVIVSAAEVQARLYEVLWAAFLLGALFGAIAQRTHFCTMGAIADVVAFGDWTRMRMWLLAIGVAIVGFNAMVWLGWVEASKSLYGGTRLTWLSAVVGGLMFGSGMVLSSGCGSKALVRLGGGSLKALVVCLVLGLSAFATIKGITATARAASVDTVFIALPAGQDLPSLAAHLLQGSRRTLALVLGIALGGAAIAVALARREGRDPQTLLAGLGIGAVIVAAWWVSGRLGFVAEDPTTLEEAFLATNSRRMEAMSFVAPVAYTIDWLLWYSDASKLLTIGIVSCIGVVAGSALVAIASRGFRWEGFRGVEDTANHVVGAGLMGVGGVTALGCTVGQGLSGVSTLGLTSFVALGSIIAGALLALRYQAWRVALTN